MFALIAFDEARRQLAQALDLDSADARDIAHGEFSGHELHVPHWHRAGSISWRLLFEAFTLRPVVSTHFVNARVLPCGLFFVGLHCFRQNRPS